MNTQTRKNYLVTFIVSISILLASTILFSFSADALENEEKGKDKSVAQKMEHSGKEWREKHEEIKEKMDEFFEGDDYEGWSAWMQESPMGHNHSQMINEETFKKMREVHQLMEDGNVEAAKEIMEALRQQSPMIRKFHETSPQVKAALHAGDYNAFLVAAPNAAEEITEERFLQMVTLFKEREARIQVWLKEKGLTEAQIEELKNAQDVEEKKELLQEWNVQNLTLPFHQRDKGGMRGHLNQLTDEQKDVLKEFRKNGNKEAIKSYQKGLGIKIPQMSEQE